MGGAAGTELARRAAEAAAEKQARDVVVLDLRGYATVADYFVICEADSDRQIRAICEELDLALGRLGSRLLRREGEPDSGWVLLDFGDLVVHVFSPELRAYYEIERLWSAVPPILRIQ
ncbi:MAG: ribosome silencing factor [Chloroflexi bacterium]|nr:ribosome silencing factor [Chloroflexota bacterium]